MARPAKIKPGTINRDFRTIRAMLKKALPGFHFTPGLFLPENGTRVTWLRPEEEAVVCATMPAPFGDMARMAASTMMRLTEIRTLRREQGDPGHGVVTLPRTKAGPRQVILSAEARGLLAKGIEATGGVYLFPNTDGNHYSRSQVSRVWHKAAMAAGLSDFHDLRHHGATMALNAGFSSSIVMSLGGWNSERVMRRYAAVTDRTLRAAAEAVSGNGQWQ